MKEKNMTCQASNELMVPGLGYDLVGVVDLPVGLLSVDVLQDVHPGHPFPLRPVELSTGLKVDFGKYVVLNEEDPRLRKRGRRGDEREHMRTSDAAMQSLEFIPTYCML